MALYEIQPDKLSPVPTTIVRARLKVAEALAKEMP